MWETARPWEEKWESFKLIESKMVVQALDDEDRQVRVWRRRPDGFTVNEKEHIIYVLEFTRVSDTGQEYVTETQQLAAKTFRNTRHGQLNTPAGCFGWTAPSTRAQC